MFLSGLTFAKARGATRLGFTSRAQRSLTWGTVVVQAVLISLSAILFAKGFLIDYPAADSFLDPGTLMTMECGGLLSLATFLYWVLSGVHLRTTARSHWQADAFYAVCTIATAVTIFVFGYTHALTEVYAKYLYIELAWFMFALLGVSLIPWVSGAIYILRWSKPLLMFVVAGLVLRGLALTLLVIGRLYFQGTKIYDQSLTDSIVANIGFTSPQEGVITILWLLLLLLAFASAIGILVLCALGTDSFLRSTTRVSRSFLPGAFSSAVIALGFTVHEVVLGSNTSMVWIVLAVSAGTSLVFLGLNVFLKVKDMPEILRTLAICLQLLVIVTASFALQYFLTGTDTERSAGFVMTIPALLVSAIHQMVTGVGKGALSQRPVTMVLSAIASAAVSYAFLTVNGFADLLPREVPVKTMFNFILIGAVLFSAVYACGRLLFATNAGTRLLALRAAGV